MKPALLLVDLQQDFLQMPGLDPAAGALVGAAAELLAACRAREVPVLHLWTTVQRVPDDRMPHWQAAGTWRCVEGTPGHAPPEALAPRGNERVFHKRFFGGFAAGDLHGHLKTRGCDTLLVAGIHLHACVRTVALEAYERGYHVWIADDATGSDDPLHAAITRRYLAARSIRFAPMETLRQALEPSGRTTSVAAPAAERYVHHAPAHCAQVLWEVAYDDAPKIQTAARAARAAFHDWHTRPFHERADILRQWAAKLTLHHDALSLQITWDIGKPITMARGEMKRSAELLCAVAAQSEPPETATSAAARYRHAPLGVVAIITPYNNPVAIPAGKIAPALLFGNTVIWKPSPAATMIARQLLDLARQAGLPEAVLQVCAGDSSAALQLAADRQIDAVTISGASRAGFALQEMCAKTFKPYQAELGGNNAAIVWDDSLFPMAAEKIASGAFGFAGQRCTANRRAIVPQAHMAAFLRELEQATAGLAWGDPCDGQTSVGPLISAKKRDAIQALLRRAASEGAAMCVPHRAQANHDALLAQGALHPPVIVFAGNPSCEIVQEESFGPVLVVQAASDFAHALALANGVRQGLVMALFSHDARHQQQFLRQARAGVLKLDSATADADAISPLGGWKASGVGPAEHGPADREFFTRVQTIYQG